MPSLSLPTVKALFARSRNACAFPKCFSPLVEDSGTVTGEICHIKSAKLGGPRYDDTQSDTDRHAASNLVLLCSRHHKIIDSELGIYTVSVVAAMKRDHEGRGIAEITASVSRGAQALLDNYAAISVVGNTGQVAINSPGAIQANTINFKTSRSKVVVASPDGSVGASVPQSSYCTYLIKKYQECQKADDSGKTDYKFMAIYKAIERQFKSKWQLVPESKFDELVEFLQKKIDGTILGKRIRASGKRFYHSYAEHPK